MASFTSSCLVVQRRCGSWCFQRVSCSWLLLRGSSSLLVGSQHRVEMLIGTSPWGRRAFSSPPTVYFPVFSFDFAQSFLPISDIVHVSIVSWMFGTRFCIYFFLELEDVVFFVRH